jgi:hypothetical protein
MSARHAASFRRVATRSRGTVCVARALDAAVTVEIANGFRRRTVCVDEAFHALFEGCLAERCVLRVAIRVVEAVDANTSLPIALLALPPAIRVAAAGRCASACHDVAGARGITLSWRKTPDAALEWKGRSGAALCCIPSFPCIASPSRHRVPSQEAFGLVRRCWSHPTTRGPTGATAYRASSRRPSAPRSRRRC